MEDRWNCIAVNTANFRVQLLNPCGRSSQIHHETFHVIHIGIYRSSVQPLFYTVALKYASLSKENCTLVATESIETLKLIVRRVQSLNFLGRESVTLFFYLSKSTLQSVKFLVFIARGDPHFGEMQLFWVTYYPLQRRVNVSVNPRAVCHPDLAERQVS